jgi:gas vesicle protein
MNKVNNLLQVASATIFRPFMVQHRFYRKHTWQFSDNDQGFSVKVSGNVNRAVRQLRNMVQEARVRDIVRLQSRFESKPDKRRRKRKENDWKLYLEGVQRNVKKALELKTKYL